MIFTSKVFLVGAGPGDPKLLTLRGREVLESADVILYDSLIGNEILGWARADAEKIFVGKRAGEHALSQEAINALIIKYAQTNKTVCRLKGGDPFVFGRGGEEALACVENNIPFEIVPGVSSAIAAPAYAGIPVTHREVAKSFAVVTGHTKYDDAPPQDLPHADTLIFLMGVRALPKIVASLLQRGEARRTPVALIRWGTMAQQQVVTATLETIKAEVARVGLKPPALIVVGEVVKLREQLRWFDARPLWGKTIVVTRAREQASSLVEGLQSLGARVLQCPTIKIEPLPEAEYSVLDGAIEQIQNFDWVVFTSCNGVAYFWNRLHKTSKDTRVFRDAKIVAIGPATCEELLRHGIIADLVPESSISEAVAEVLIEQGIGDKRVLILTAQEGREVLPQKLREAGAEVTVAPCYRNVPDASNVEDAENKLREGAVDWITFTSSSTVTNFVEAIGHDVLSEQRESFRVACIGPVTEKTARVYGLTPDVTAPEASVEALINALVEVSTRAG